MRSLPYFTHTHTHSSDRSLCDLAARLCVVQVVSLSQPRRGTVALRFIVECNLRLLKQETERLRSIVTHGGWFFQFFQANAFANTASQLHYYPIPDDASCRGSSDVHACDHHTWRRLGHRQQQRRSCPQKDWCKPQP